MTVSRRSFIAGAGLIGATAALGGCTVERDDAGEEPGTDSGEESGVSPFTGEETAAGRPVLTVKIDNAPQARPATGLDEADVVYGLPVEGGISRMLAVFSSTIPDTVGPVRSLRESDVELLAQFDRPAVAYSGAHPELVPELTDAPMLPLIPDDATPYLRDQARQAPHNLYLRAQDALDALAEKPGTAGDIGFRFGAAPDGGEEVETVTHRYPAAAWGATWSAAEERWMISLDDAPAESADGRPLSAATVVFQQVELGETTLGDPGTPYVRTVGEGTAQVLRDGRSYDARWQRGNEEEGTVYRTADGERLPFATGPVWVILVGN